jgi:hypothetical protein
MMKYDGYRYTYRVLGKAFSVLLMKEKGGREGEGEGERYRKIEERWRKYE